MMLMVIADFLTQMFHTKFVERTMVEAVRLESRQSDVESRK
jgi:hypothetical protein